MGKKDDYNKYVDQVSPKPTYVKNYILAFIVGGIICMIGQGINDFFMKVINLDKLAASSATSITLIFIGSFLTGLGVYDLIGKRDRSWINNSYYRFCKLKSISSNGV